MGLYDRRILPHLTHLAMRSPMLAGYRARTLARARGDVLEIGMGSGLNLPFYGHEVRRVVGIEPSPQLAHRAERAARGLPFPVEILVRSAETLPLPDASIDTAVTTWTLCTIPDPVQALREVRRVLRPGGALLFVEHGRAPERTVARWQERLTPLWSRCAGGCHLDRSIADLVGQAGFRIDRLATGYLRGPRVLAFMYEGTAYPAADGATDRGPGGPPFRVGRR